MKDHSNYTLLIVDDEPGIRKVLKIELSDEGYTVVTAESGEKALEEFRIHTPEIVLTDIKMPGMNGIELLRSIKQENPDTEVIMISGHGDMDLAIQSIKHDAIDFVTKPINNEILAIALKRAHDKISTRQKLREYTHNLENLVKEKSAKIVRLERQEAVDQALEGVATAFRGIAENFENGITYFNEMPCYVAIHNRQLDIVTINQLYRDRIGDKIGKKSWEIYAGKDHTIRPCPVEITLQTGVGQRSKHSIYGADGEIFPVMVHTAPIRNRSEEIELVLEVSADVTEMNRLQAELRNTQQRFQQLFDEVPCYISVQDRDYKIVEANKRFKEEFGNATGAHCYDAYKHRNDPCPQCPVAKTFKDGLSHSYETIVKTKNGEENHMLVWTSPIRDADNRIIQVMEMSTNITEVRLLQDHLSSLGLLIGSVSHGIKGLLTGLDSGMYLLNSGFSKGNQDQVEEGWQTVRLMVERIRSMILDILYYAKEEDLKWERVDVATFVEEIVATMERKMADDHIELSTELAPNLDTVEIDTGIIKSTLMNMLENAIHACREDEGKTSHQILLQVTQSADEICFKVQDNGIGMDPNTQKRLFRTVLSTKGKKGTGLGLFISSKIIEQSGGRITVSSEPGNGATFILKIPKQPALTNHTNNKKRKKS